MSIPGALTCTLRQRARRAAALCFMVLVALAAASFSPAAAGHHRARALRPRLPASARPPGIGPQSIPPRVRDLPQPGVLRV